MDKARSTFGGLLVLRCDDNSLSPFTAAQENNENQALFSLSHNLICSMSNSICF
jgi:hypothetical protein